MEEERAIPLSYLSQYFYCVRRAALLLVEQQWEDNQHTAEGIILHERADSGLDEKRGDQITLRSLLVRSERLGLSGKCDVVEAFQDPQGVALPGYTGQWRLRPVEYKHGTVRKELEYEVQLCAQAMCLEEMLGGTIADGDLFYGGEHRRVTVAFDTPLRERVVQGAQGLHEMLAKGELPAPKWTPRCKGCSMVDICQPRLRRSALAYLHEVSAAAKGEE